RPHPREPLGDLRVGALGEQPGGPILVEFLEHVRLKLGISVHMPEDLGLLLLGRLLKKVGDLSWFQPPDPRERAAQSHAAGMADQRLEPGPVAERMFLSIAAAEAKEPQQAAGS